MSNMVLQSTTGSDYKPHPEGIHPAVCVDVIDLGLQEVEYQGERKMVNKVKLTFESEQKMEDGGNFRVSKNFTASLHPKSKLSDFLGKWRGRPIAPGETIELPKLIGASCTLVISHQQSMVGRTYAAIDAISKPTKKVVPSGTYDPDAARQRIADWQTKSARTGAPAPRAGATAPAPVSAQQTVPPKRQTSPAPQEAPAADYDPEVGF